MVSDTRPFARIELSVPASNRYAKPGPETVIASPRVATAGAPRTGAGRMPGTARPPTENWSWPTVQPRFAQARSVALFSATLSPWNYYADTLGMPANTAWIYVDSPFVADQMAVHVAGHISTRYQHRER